MKRKLTILLLMFISLTTYGQHNFGLKFNAGLSRISNSSSLSNLLTTHLAPSGQLGFFYNVQLNRKSILGSECLFVQVEGKEKGKSDIFDVYGNNAGVFSGEFYRHISYLSFPIYYGYKFNKLTVNIGFQASLLLTSSSRDKIKITNNNGDVTNWDTKYDELNIDRYDFGPRAGLTYSLTDKFTIDGTYYFGVNNILNKDVPDWIWRVQQATVGLRYTLLTTKKNKKE